MPVNLNKPQQWKADIIQSVDMYNDWFMKFAPKAFRTTRVQTTIDVEAALHATDNITNIQPALMRKHPEILPTLRMSTCPPLAVDRLIGLGRRLHQPRQVHGAGKEAPGPHEGCRS